MKVNKASLVNMLKRTQRFQNVGGRSVAQVNGCQLMPQVDDGEVRTLSLVRDGKTSLSSFSAALEEGEMHYSNPIPVPDIDVLLGVLASHGSTVSIRHDIPNNKILVSSGKKKTILTASMNGLVFPHSSDTITEWSSKSAQLGDKFQFADGLFKGYQMQDGSIHEPFLTLSVDGNELHEALRADNMNGQRLNRYRFSFSDEGLIIGVGEEMKGFTETKFDDFAMSTFDEEHWFAWDFEGGLENVLANVNGTVFLSFLDFREYGQGIRMVINMGQFGWVYQAGVLA